eukprot:Sdes_comp18665_c0_seq1m8901
MSDKPTIRVASKHLPQLVGRHVRIIGKVHKEMDMNGNTCNLETCDGGSVKVFSTESGNSFTTFVEFVGLVNSDLSIQEFTHINLGENFDLEFHNSALQLAMNQNYKQIFLPAC